MKSYTLKTKGVLLVVVVIFALGFGLGGLVL